METDATTVMERCRFYAKIGAKGGRLSRACGFGSLKVGLDGLTGLQRARNYGVITFSCSCVRRLFRLPMFDTDAVVHPEETRHKPEGAAHRRHRAGRHGGRSDNWAADAPDTAAGQQDAAGDPVVDDRLDLEANVIRKAGDGRRRQDI